MTDLAGVSLVLSSIKAATDIARLLKDTNLSLEKAEAKLKLAELVGALADARIQIAEVQDLLLEKETKIKKLEERIVLILEKAVLLRWRQAPISFLARSKLMTHTSV